MKIVLYTGTDESHCNYFAEYFYSLGIEHKIGYDYFGYRFEVLNIVDVSNITNIIICFYIEYHLKNYILSKIYDEYPYIDIDDAADVLCSLTKNINNSDIFHEMKNQILKNKKIHVESYLLFNIRKIMLTIYDHVDKICEKKSFEKERERFLELIRIYSRLSTDISERANVEFSSESECFLTFDNDKPIRVYSDEIISQLITRPPLNITIKGENYSPELSQIIKEIFMNNTKE